MLDLDSCWAAAFRPAVTIFAKQRAQIHQSLIDGRLYTSLLQESKLSTEELMLLSSGVGDDLRVPWTARRSSQSIRKEINPEFSLVGLMKLQYFGHLMQRADSLEKRPWCWGRLKAGGEGGDTGRDGWMASPTQWTRVWANSGRWWRTGKPGVLQTTGRQRVRHDRGTEHHPVWSRRSWSSIPPLGGRWQAGHGRRALPSQEEQGD